MFNQGTGFYFVLKKGRSIKNIKFLKFKKILMSETSNLIFFFNFAFMIQMFEWFH